VAAYTIGFVELEVHDRIEDAVGAGSGTLVTVGKVPGILMAVRVLDNQPGPGRGGHRRLLSEADDRHGGRHQDRTARRRLLATGDEDTAAPAHGRCLEPSPELLLARMRAKVDGRKRRFNSIAREPRIDVAFIYESRSQKSKKRRRPRREKLRYRPRAPLQSDDRRPRKPRALNAGFCRRLSHKARSLVREVGEQLMSRRHIRRMRKRDRQRLAAHARRLGR
jgi:hypothetical protein